MSEDKILFNKKLDELYDLIHEKLMTNFDLNKINVEYVKRAGSLTLRINNTEFYAEFGNRPAVLICEDITKRSDEIFIELDLTDGNWMMTTFSKMNPNKHQYSPFPESVLNRTIKHFTFISGYKE